MKKYSNLLYLLVFTLLLSECLQSQELHNKFWLKSGTIIISSKLEIGKYGFKDSKYLKIDFKSLDSMLTNDSTIIAQLSKSYKILQIIDHPQGVLIEGFENIRRNALNIGMELWGKSIVGGANLSFIYHEKNSFEFGYGNGEAGTGLFSSAKAKNMYYFSYSYLYGPSSSKLEIGSGFSYGRAMFTEGFLSSDTTGNFKGLMISLTIGYRYQRPKSGLFFKTGFSPIVFTKPKVGASLLFNIGFGYTFVL